MQIPHDKKTLAVFLRDYGGRRTKTRSEKIAIMKKILEDRVIILDDIHVVLNQGQWDHINGLYHKYILGKFSPGFPESAVVALYKKGSEGFTLREIADQLDCTTEVARRRAISLVDKGVLIRGANPENKREGIFCIKSKYVTKGKTKAGKAKAKAKPEPEPEPAKAKASEVKTKTKTKPAKTKAKAKTAKVKVSEAKTSDAEAEA